MLSYLRVRGLALLDDVALSFEPGMNVLTGETGAGKSIIVGALSLLRGSRGRIEMVRDGDDAAVVDAQFEPRAAAAARLRTLLAAHALPEDELQTLVVQRVLPRGGRGRCVVQAALTTQVALARLGEELIDICSQHEHHFLTHTARHLDVLDAYAGTESEVAEYAAKFRQWRDALARLEDLRARARERTQRADYLRFQIEEIDRIAPEPDEHETLRRRVGLMREAHRWVEFAREAQAALYEDDDAIASRLGALAERAKGGAEDSEMLSEIQDQLAAAQVACEEAAQMASRLLADLDLDPQELEGAEDRLHELEGLRRKHGVGVEALCDRADEMRTELVELDHAEEHVQALEARTEELERSAWEAAEALHLKRRQAGTALGPAVARELAALQIPAARLEVEITRASELGPVGFDHVEFQFSANRGESLAPLRKVASGGELSRVLLAMKGVLAAGDRVATYVFDEVDAGVGGAVAEAIGQRLRRAARAHQVLCITHLPQIAAFADAHFRVEKHGASGRTVTRVVRLTPEERVEELARMLAGKKVTASAREHAVALLEGAATVPAAGSKAGGPSRVGRRGSRSARS